MQLFIKVCTTYQYPLNRCLNQSIDYRSNVLNWCSQPRSQLLLIFYALKETENFAHPRYSRSAGSFLTKS